MTDSDVRKITEAASAVMAALEGLSDAERARVLESAAALYAVGAPTRRSQDRAEAVGDPGVEASQQVQSGKPLSIVEFLSDKAPATNAQRIACFAYYREYVERKSRFARGDLEGYFSAAKLAKPGNYDRDFSSAVREGWIHEDGASSYLTQNGEKAVAAGFAGKAKPRGAATRKKKPQSAT